MLWSWIPYRKAARQGLQYVSGACELDSLRQTIESSIRSIEEVGTDHDESLVALRKWQEMVLLALGGEITESQLAEWIVYQDPSFPSEQDATA